VFNLRVKKLVIKIFGKNSSVWLRYAKPNWYSKSENFFLLS